MTVTTFTWAAVVLLLSLAGGCVVPTLDTKAPGPRRALRRGEIKEILASYEAQAREAEKNATASWFPDQYWETAATAYRQASTAALFSGQLQKSITFAHKSLEIAEKIRNPVLENVSPLSLQLRAINLLIAAYQSVRNFDKAREFIEKGLVIVKQIPLAYANARLNQEGNLHHKLGKDLVRRREYGKAVDAFSQAVSLQQGALDLLYRVRNRGP